MRRGLEIVEEFGKIPGLCLNVKKIKAIWLGISQLIYSASNLPVPAGIEDSVKTKCFNFLWRNKKDKIKRSGLYQDTSKGGLRMTDMGLMFKSLKLAWIPRILSAGKRNRCTVPDHHFRKMGGLNFLLI